MAMLSEADLVPLPPTRLPLALRMGLWFPVAAVLVVAVAFQLGEMDSRANLLLLSSIAGTLIMLCQATLHVLSHPPLSPRHVRLVTACTLTLLGLFSALNVAVASSASLLRLP